VALVGAGTGGYLYWGRPVQPPAASASLTDAVDRTAARTAVVTAEPIDPEAPRPKVAAARERMARPAPSEARFLRPGRAGAVLPIRAIPGAAGGNTSARGAGSGTVAGKAAGLARLSDLDHPLRRLAGELPELPAGAPAGRVVVRLLVGADGRVLDAEVTDGPGGLAETARRAVTRWRYAPPVVDGRPVRVWTTEIIDLTP